MLIVFDFVVFILLELKRCDYVWLLNHRLVTDWLVKVVLFSLQAAGPELITVCWQSTCSWRKS